LVRDLPFKITLFFIGFDIDLWFTNLTDLTLNSFSRETELKADNNAIKLLKKHNINPYCASNFFQELPDFPVWFMSSHPINKKRIDNMQNNFIWEKSFNKCVEIKRKL
jgi:predicted Zn-dependent protease